MSLEQKKQLAGSPFEIGSHGFDHLDLRDADLNQLKKEIHQSKLQLEADLGIKVYSFAYPFGFVNDQVRTFIRKSDYFCAVNTDTGGLDFSEDRFSLFRVNVFPEDGALQLWKKTESWYRKYFFFKRKR